MPYQLVIKSYAKLNLYLRVINKRSDNYHNLKTIFERISLADRIILKPRKDNLIKVSCNNKAVPLDEANLCFKAAKLLRDKFAAAEGLDINIAKHIPVGAGLGGGSGNAAAVLRGLNKLWKLKLSKAMLAKLATKIGSDVAFFVYDLPFAVGAGRGERIKPLNNLKKIKFWHILIVPDIHVSTPLIYKKWDNLNKKEGAGLTKPVCDVKILISALAKKNSFTSAKRILGIRPAGTPLFNSLEKITIRLYPEVKRIKDTLLRLGLDCVLMSGSGPAVFAIVPSGKDALRIAKIIGNKNKGWRVFVVKTV
ncbi:MAG: 4-(cytidine 5'-diphospho)-2-C-methyl-D-erythritol kinase [Candidatus Omnitrophica bacterium CG08_land_8_20_14_0_20_41_16]|uniref:4-diphosphocytidyl-2-C-methyl-D-erythritol kinase n=1 Tax=Candidatus Sherwoodlollariibacterium unditelluris TaxID=1974757 RepID=A0A2G9YK22_9BACT|nr:MAG: 4-(cytidine 5'-diphospho)-2-C-methyl-D-erythritol kinase [Candidatus Omnitrophica bacterium CG23_combo_of_CG06-09_8_20_14_all_41_10]PIS33640.1 MAG: 4-(cytidine 5'-diphospho)-2-C-methyl-D-erythritol kinase [Candidatus Omnitrophica bacterium CG08_land_8_20_14_0_20_41_16]